MDQVHFISNRVENDFQKEEINVLTGYIGEEAVKMIADAGFQFEPATRFSFFGKDKFSMGASEPSSMFLGSTALKGEHGMAIMHEDWNRTVLLMMREQLGEKIVEIKFCYLDSYRKFNQIDLVKTDTETVDREWANLFLENRKSDSNPYPFGRFLKSFIEQVIENGTDIEIVDATETKKGGRYTNWISRHPSLKNKIIYRSN
jgi:hypothetical protein